MRNIFPFFSPFCVFLFVWEAHTLDIPISEKAKRHVVNGSIYSVSKVTDIEKHKQQKLFLEASALHPKSCRYALRKLAYYENYAQYVSFIKKSTYLPKDKHLHFLLDSPLLPFSMVLELKFPRMTGPGVYPFVFEKGFLSGLKGEISLYDHKNRCLMHATALWQGKHTGINSTVFEFFSNALMRMAIFTLVRISRAP